MALLSSTHQKSKRMTLTVSIHESLLTEVRAYCSWAGIQRPGEFIVQSIDYILKNDKEWRKVMSQQSLQNLQE